MKIIIHLADDITTKRIEELMDSINKLVDSGEIGTIELRVR